MCFDAVYFIFCACFVYSLYFYSKNFLLHDFVVLLSDIFLPPTSPQGGISFQSCVCVYSVIMLYWEHFEVVRVDVNISHHLLG